MPTVLRNGRVVPNADELPASNISSNFEARRTYPKPTSYLLLVYPVILAVGSLFSILSPIASPPVAPLTAGVTSEVNRPSFYNQVNYFASKRNAVNLYFVKFGWFWTTLAFALLLLTTRPPPANKATHYTRSLTRYAIITFTWFLTTQWFFGPAIIDRSFTITGGICEAPTIQNISDLGKNVEMGTYSSSIACKGAGGRWRGGHDMSGHVFMLCLSSAFLLYELYIADTNSSHPSVSPEVAAKLAHELTDEEKKSMGGWESETVARVRVYARYLLWGVVALDFWMMMMTAIWFHTWLEKLSGLFLAAGTIWTVYFLSDFVPAWKEVVGGFD